MKFRSIIIGLQNEHLSFPGSSTQHSRNGLQFPTWSNSISQEGINLILETLEADSITLYSIHLSVEESTQLEFQLPATSSFCICQLKGAMLLNLHQNTGFFIGQSQVLALVQPNQRFTIQINGCKETQFILFTAGDPMESILSPLTEGEIRPFVPSLFLYSLIVAASELIRNSRLINEPYIEQLRYLMFSACHEQQVAHNSQRRLYTGEKDEWIIYALTEEMIMKLDSPLRAKQLCQQYNLTLAQLNNILKKRFGETFASFRMKLRMEKALKLLQDKDIPLTDIADQTGFSSLSHFSAAFKKKYGNAPKTVRKESGNQVGDFSSMQQG